MPAKLSLNSFVFNLVTGLVIALLFTGTPEYFLFIAGKPEGYRSRHLQEQAKETYLSP